MQLLVVGVDPVTRIKIGEFDEYVQPLNHAIRMEASMAVHGIRPHQDQICCAKPIEEVWERFTTFIESKLDSCGKIGIIAAWGGQGCDYEWLFLSHQREPPWQTLHPQLVPIFLYPKTIIQHYVGCSLIQNKPKLMVMVGRRFGVL